ncbi:MAG: substrate-binding domain-containing protein [Bdellovibrio sp.]|nr:substrate-binding domain-containing protein [Bdellovibrio sp.]
MKIEGQVAMRKGFEEEIGNFNKKSSDKIKITPYVAGEGRKGIVQQVSQMDEAVKKKPHAIVIQPTDNSALASGLLLANKANIPVIAYDQYIVNGTLASFLTSDNYQGGWDDGLHVESLFDRSHEIQIVVFEYPRVSSTIDRVDGFFDALRSRGQKFRVLKRYDAVDPESGEKAAKKFLQDFPTKGSVDLILTVNDGGGISIVKALWEKKRTEIRHATFDGAPESIQNIKEERLTVVNSAQYCAELGRETARTLIAALLGKSISPKKLIPTFPVTKQNVKEYPGWMGRPTGNFAQRDNQKLSSDLDRRPSSQKNRNILNIRIGVAPLCPYLCETGPGKWSGYIYDILTEVAKARDFSFQLESIPNTRLVSALQTGKVNYIIVPSYIVRYLSDIRVMGPKLGVSYTGALLPSADKESIIDEESFRNKKVIFGDMATDPELKVDLGNAVRGTKLTGADVSERMIKMIGDGRASLALGDYNVLRYSLMKDANPSLRLTATSLTGFNSLVLVGTPKQPEFGYLPKNLDDWFREARIDGTLKKILEKYNLQDWDIFTRG